MKLSDLIKDDNIIEIKANNKEGVLKDFVNYISKLNLPINKDELYQKLLDREKMETTAIENNIAIPHCKIDKIKEPLLFIGISYKGVYFSPNKNDLTKIFFFVISPADSPALHLKILASVAKIAK